MRAHGRSVPQDVGVIGFDGTQASGTTEPPLSTVRQHLVELGRGMAEMLLRHIDDSDQTIEAEILPIELIVRESTVEGLPPTVPEDCCK